MLTHCVPEQPATGRTFVSLYAGAGGMDLGFALAGFTPVWINEVDGNAAATHDGLFRQISQQLPHVRHTPVVTADLLDIPDDALPATADLVIGGPPCQGFSVGGKMDPNDERSRHVFHFMDVIKRVEPEGFVMENVKALYQNSRFSVVRQQLKEKAADLGYRAEMFLLNASHFGVPQSRERLMFIGFRDRTPCPPLPSTESNPPTLREALELLPRFGSPGNDSTCNAKVTPAVSPVLRKSPYAGMLFNGGGRPMNLDVPAPTLPATMGGNRTPIVDQEEIDGSAEPWVVRYHEHLMNGGEPAVRIPERMRRITVQEAAAIQTFPLDMRWFGPQSSQYRQIGNAVPPLLGFAVAEMIASQLS